MLYRDTQIGSAPADAADRGFYRNAKRLEQAWAAIPPDTHILVTHSPPHNVLDGGGGSGCPALLARLGVCLRFTSLHFYRAF
jgi:hypothetical protein